MSVKVLAKPEHLTWRHFKVVGSIPGTPADAQTAPEVSVPGFRPAKVDGKFRLTDLTVTVSLNTRQTIVRKSAKQTPELLDHEQGHFDLLVLVATAMAAEFESAEGASVKELASILQDLRTKHQQRAADLDAEYDKQTNHSRDTVQQRRWRSLIDNAATSKAAQIDGMDL